MEGLKSDILMMVQEQPKNLKGLLNHLIPEVSVAAASTKVEFMQFPDK